MSANERDETLEYLRTAIEFAPADPGPIAPDLLGWFVPVEKLFFCAHCAGRIIARGCRLPANVRALTHDGTSPFGAALTCRLCGRACHV